MYVRTKTEAVEICRSQILFHRLAFDAGEQFDVRLCGTRVYLLQKHFFDLEKADFRRHVYLDAQWFFAARADFDAFDRIRRILMDVADRRSVVESERDARSALCHIAAIGDEDDARFERMDFARTHVADDAFHRKRADRHAPYEVFAPGNKFVEQPFDDGEREKNAVQFVILPADRHAEVVQKRREYDGGQTVGKGARFFFLQAQLYARFIQYLRHFDRVVRHRAHVYRPVIVVAEPHDGNVVAVILHRFDFLIAHERFRDGER